MRKRLAVTVAALLLAAHMGEPGDAAEPSIEQLEVISGLIEAGNIESLIVFVMENPHLTEGEGAVALRLREFMETARDLSTYLAFDAGLRFALAEGAWEAEGSSLY